MDEAPQTSAPGVETPPPARRTPRRRCVAVLVAVALVVLVLDQVAKAIALAQLSDGHVVRLLGGLLTLRLVRNPGAAFGLAAGATIVFSLVALGVVLVVARFASRLASLPWAISLGLLLGGAVGNLVDRVVRDPAPLRGHVVDFLELPHWPVFNLADSAIVLAGVSMVVYTLRGLNVDGTVHRG